MKYVIGTFLLHASIANPLGESGKLQLTSDMTELEFSLGALMADKNQPKRGVNWEPVGGDYRALRAMRLVITCCFNHLYLNFESNCRVIGHSYSWRTVSSHPGSTQPICRLSLFYITSWFAHLSPFHILCMDGQRLSTYAG